MIISTHLITATVINKLERLDGVTNNLQISFAHSNRLESSLLLNIPCTPSWGSAENITWGPRLSKALPCYSGTICEASPFIGATAWGERVETCTKIDWKLFLNVIQILYSFCYLEFVTSIRFIAEGFRTTGEEGHIGLGYGLDVVCLP